MKVEIEIKLRLPAELEEIRRALRHLGFRVAKHRVHESNVLFDNSKRTLRKHGKLIRLRQVGRHSVLTYKGPSQKSKYKKRPEVEVDMVNGDAIEGIFAHIGYHPVFRYEKYRTEFAKPRVAGTVMLDETPIGNFLEIEGSPRFIDRTAKLLGFSFKDYINRSYGYLYLAHCRERRISPANMTFGKRIRRARRSQ